ncbi:MAG: GTP-binding protein [Candidatus Methanofastidiosa archaeon]|jgi:small GTP-binding protein|nr:GTP-binding protein [Candidatus Methanofastidiosa archaeon]
MEDVKVVVFGKENVGKSTLIKAIEHDAINLDKNNTTVSMDYGRTVVGGKKIHFYGTPGQQRFDFMRDILSQGADIGLMVIDATSNLSSMDIQLLKEFRAKNIPCIVFINKTDIGFSDSIRQALNGFPIIEGSAKMGFGLTELLRSLMNFA